MASDSSAAGFFAASQVNPTRSLLLFAIGALVGLGIAGYSLFTAEGTATRTVPPENIATVNRRPVLRSDFITQLENETGAPFAESSREDQLKVLDDMVREELLVQRALELDFGETDQDARNALVSAVTQQILAEVTISQPTEEQLQQYFTEHRSKYVTEGLIAVRNLLLPKAAEVTEQQAMAKAQDVVDALRANTPVEQVARRFGLTEDPNRDEDFYFAARIRIGATQFENIRQLHAGAVAEPFATNDGIRIVKVISNAPPAPLTFERARQQVFSDYKTDSQTQLLEATLKFLRGRSKILIADDYKDAYQP